MTPKNKISGAYFLERKFFYFLIPIEEYKVFKLIIIFTIIFPLY